VSFEKKNCSNSNKGLQKYKSILDFVKSLSIPERKKLITEIQIDNYFDELSKCEVVKDNR